MNRYSSAKIIGFVAILCSLTFWVEVAVTTIIGHTPFWLDVGFKGWFVGWALGVLLALLAAWLGSRRWAFVILLPVISFFVAVTNISK